MIFDIPNTPGWLYSKPPPNPDPREDPKSRSPNSGLYYSYGVDYGVLRWIYFLDPPRGLGKRGPYLRCRPKRHRQLPRRQASPSDLVRRAMVSPAQGGSFLVILASSASFKGNYRAPVKEFGGDIRSY